uniref:Putative transcriptional regulator n=1 Tax=viral metagenome TaxID=1070528 RepID=A0A6M3M3P1_9ZZZZ
MKSTRDSIPVSSTYRNKGTPHSYYTHYGALTWSIKEVNILKKYYPDTKNTVEELKQKLLGRTEEAIRQKASDLGLKRQWPETDDHLSENESCPYKYNKMDINYLLSYGERCPPNPVEKMKELLSYFENIVTSKNRKKIYLYLLEKQASTPQCVVADLGLPEQSVYRELKHLTGKGILEYAVKPRHQRKTSGKVPGIISFPNCDKSYIQEAIKRDKIRKHPKSKLVQRLTQLILEEYFADLHEKEIYYTSIVGFVKQECKGFAFKDIMAFSDEIAETLHFKEITVWRNR